MQLHSSLKELSTHIRRVVHGTAVSRHRNIGQACHANETLNSTSCLMLVIACSTITLVCGEAVPHSKMGSYCLEGGPPDGLPRKDELRKMKGYSISCIGSIHAAFGNMLSTPLNYQLAENTLVSSN